MKNIILKITAAIILLFSLITIFTSAAVLFDLFGVREKQGNFVFFVVASNFIIGISYLWTVYGFFKEKKWTTFLLTIILSVLIISFSALLIHISSGGIYEMKTIYAMIFRISITLLFTVISWLFISREKEKK